MNDVLLFLLAQNDSPEPGHWLDALEDMFGELSDGDRVHLAAACDAMLAGVRRSPVPSRADE